MKKTLIIATTILAPLALQAEPKSSKGAGRAPSAEIIAKFDTDGDGKLSKAERKVARPELNKMAEKRKAEILAKFDADGDGKLNSEEKKAAALARFDADGDGKLNEAEKKASMEALEARKKGPRGKGPKNGKKGPGAKKGQKAE